MTRPLEVLPTPSWRTRAVQVFWVATAVACLAGVVTLLVEGSGTPALLTAAVLVVVLGAAVLSLLRPAGLVVDPDGMTMTQLWTRKRWEFADAGPFGTARAPGSLARGRLVAWEHRSGGRSRRAVLPTSFGLTAEDLAAVLNTHRQRVLEPGTR